MLLDDAEIARVFKVDPRCVGIHLGFQVVEVDLPLAVAVYPDKPDARAAVVFHDRELFRVDQRGDDHLGAVCDPLPMKGFDNHPYIPNSAPEIQAEMLREIGLASLEELHKNVPSMSTSSATMLAYSKSDWNRPSSLYGSPP